MAALYLHCSVDIHQAASNVLSVKRHDRLHEADVTVSHSSVHVCIFIVGHTLASSLYPV